MTRLTLDPTEAQVQHARAIPPEEIGRVRRLYAEPARAEGGS